MGNLRLLLAVVAASVFSALITALAMGRGGDSIPPTPVDSGQDLSQLNATLTELVSALQPLSTRVAEQGGNPEPIQRTSIGESQALHAIARHLEELKGLMGTQSWQGSSVFNSSPIATATTRRSSGPKYQAGSRCLW